MNTVIPHIMPSRSVAVIGAGPAGLAAARWLVQHGFEPFIFEASAVLGGQWNHSAEHSAVWPGMRVNTSRVMTAFSDLDYPEGTATYPSHVEVLDYLKTYASAFDLMRRIRFETPVQLLDLASGHGWIVHSMDNGHPQAEIFSHVIAASGRFQAPRLPEIDGTDSFAGDLGVAHAKTYRGADAYRGKTMLVAGCSISALEIASDLALRGAGDVIASYRRQRYVLPKLIAGVPTEHVLFTRASALAGRVLLPEMMAAGMRQKVLSVSGCPSQFGAALPDANIFAAGITQSQHFLPAVAEGRIGVRPWIERIEGRTVHFTDGSSAAPDGIIFGTGYDLSLPWMAPRIAKVLDIDGDHIDLHDHTFHPDLPGLSFIGLYDAIGPTFPVLELQARSIVYAMAGHVPMPSRQAMEHAIATARSRRGGPAGIPMPDLALLFARNAGVEPDLKTWPELQRVLLSGPMSAVSFRLEGTDAMFGAAGKAKHAAAEFGHILDEIFTPEEDSLHAIFLPGMRAA